VERRTIMGKKVCRNKSNSWRKNNTHTCNKACTRKRQLEEEQNVCMGGRTNFGRFRVLVIFRKKDEEPGMYKYRYAGII
jgi:hypothetical protein